MAKCGAPRVEDGLPCQADVPRGGTLCIWHDPARQREAAEARRRGGVNANLPPERPPLEVPGPPPKTLEEATRWAAWAVHAVASGAMDPKQGREVAYLLRAFMDGRKSVDRVDDRVRQLRAEIEKLRKGAGGR